MDNKETVRIMKNERECVIRAADGECNRGCTKCDLFMPGGDIIAAYDCAIAALEMQEVRFPISTGCTYDFRKKIAYGFWRCPRCGTEYGTSPEMKCNYCPKCGQHLLQEDEDEKRNII